MGNKITFENLEQIARSGTTEKVFEALRQLSLEEVGELLLDTPESYPALREVLPRMASDLVQINWTGTSGHALLQQSLSFVRAVASAYESFTGKQLDGASILDYGCGWGRLIRLMYKFSDPDLIYGCDAWEVSLNLCKESGIRAHLALCTEVPTEAPFPNVNFDLIYAFSVFTHLSERTSKAVMSVLRRQISLNGLLVVTIRPAEYWAQHSQQQNIADVAKMQADHIARGFAFTPHNRAPIDGDITYGDTSISLDYIRQNWQDWSVVGDRLDDADPCQRLVFLRPN